MPGSKTSSLQNSLAALLASLGCLYFTLCISQAGAKTAVLQPSQSPIPAASRSHTQAEFQSPSPSTYAAFSPSQTSGQLMSQALYLQGEAAEVPTYFWADAGAAPKAIVIALHGAVQHGRHYSALAEKLAPQGYLFYAIDFRGHGDWLARSEKRPKVDYFTTSRDVALVARQLRARHPRLPLYCIGESLGAAMAMHSSAANPDLFDGMILASAGIGPASKHHIGAAFNSIAQGIKTLGGTIDVSPHIRDISDDPRSSSEMLTDPLARRKSSVWSLLHTVKFLHSAHRAAEKIERTSTLVLQGGVDHIVNPESTQDLFEVLATDKKSFKLFPKFGHLLVTSTYLKDEVVATVEDWLTGQVDAHPAAAAAVEEGELIVVSAGERGAAGQRATP